MFVFKDWDDLQDNNDKQQYPAQAIVFFLLPMARFLSVGSYWMIIHAFRSTIRSDSLVYLVNTGRELMFSGRVSSPCFI